MTGHTRHGIPADTGWEGADARYTVTMPSVLRTAATGVLLAAALAAVAILYWQPYSDAVLTEYDNTEHYASAMERKSLADFFDYTFVSLRPDPMEIYNPVETLVWRLMAERFGRIAYPYRMLGAALHLMNVLLVFAFARLFIRGTFYPAAAAASFAVFVPNFWTVDWEAAAITTGLAALLLLSVFLLQARSFRTGSRICGVLAPVLYAIGLFAKEYVLFAFPLVTLHYLLFHRKTTRALCGRDLVLLPYILASLPILLITLARLGQSSLANDWGGVNFSVHMLYRFADYLVFLATVVPLPAGLKLATAAGIALLLPCAVYAGWRDRTALFLLLSLALFISIFVYSNFRDVYELSRYLYLPSVAWFTLLYDAASRIKARRLRGAATMLLLNYTITLNLFLILRAT